MKVLNSRQVERGERPPRFYLPIEFEPSRLVCKYSFFLFAPFIVIFKIITYGFMIMYHDLFHFKELLKDDIRRRGDNE